MKRKKQPSLIENNFEGVVSYTEYCCERELTKKEIELLKEPLEYNFEKGGEQ